MECKCESCIRENCQDRTKQDDLQIVINCDAYLEHKPTNADHIRAMADEELARHLHCIGWDCHLCSEYDRLADEPLLRGEWCDENCFEHCLEWLKQPAANGGDHDDD